MDISIDVFKFKKWSDDLIHTLVSIAAGSEDTSVELTENMIVDSESDRVQNGFTFLYTLEALKMRLSQLNHIVQSIIELSELRDKKLDTDHIVDVLFMKNHTRAAQAHTQRLIANISNDGNQHRTALLDLSRITPRMLADIADAVDLVSIAVSHWYKK